MSKPLEGYLFKLGDKGVRRTWKKRWFVQKGLKLHYYEKINGGEKGNINLEEALSVTKKTDPHKNFTFQVNLPTRIYYLHTDSEGSVSYWVNGINAILKSIANKGEEGSTAGSRMSVKNVSINDNRVRDLEGQVEKLKKGLELAAKALGLSTEEILAKAQAGEELSAKGAAAGAGGGSGGGSESGQFKAKAMFDYEPSQQYELSLKVGEEIYVLSKHQNGWWLGCSSSGTQGYFPASYVQPL